MNKEIQKISRNINDEFYSDEIDLKAVLNSILRRKSIVIFFTTSLSIINIIYTANITPIYKGDFEIHVKKEGGGDMNNATQINSNLKNFINQKQSIGSKTQEYILKSSFVLKPTYDVIREKYKDIAFKKWVKEYLEVKFIKDTNILRVAYKDSDKEFIKFVLNKIAEKYKEYSLKDKVDNLNRTKKYLEEQKIIYSEKAKNSSTIFNQFSIDNGLGDIDGFLLKNNNKSQNLLNSNISNNRDEINETNEIDKAGLRFSQQFALLEKYETEFTDYSSKLKPNSKYLANLKLRIENLKSLLKRPNEILIKYRELQKASIRDSVFLDDIENRLILIKLEKAKQPRPWQRISEPMIYDLKIFPKRSISLIKTFILSLISSSLLAFFIDKRSGLIYEFNELKNKLDIHNIGEIYMSQKILNSKLIETIFKEKLTENKDLVLKEFCIIKTYKDKDYLNINKIKEIDFEDLKNKDNLFKYSQLLFVIKEGTLTSEDIKYLNQYNSIYGDKIIGWLAAN